MAETDLAEMENEKAFEKVKKILKDGCGCALGAKAVHVLDSLRKLSYFSTLIIVWNCEMTNLIWWSSQAFRLSLTVSPLVSKEAGVLDARFIFSLYQSARRCFFTYMD